jgi:hypothetical protein
MTVNTAIHIDLSGFRFFFVRLDNQLELAHHTSVFNLVMAESK